MFQSAARPSRHLSQYAQPCDEARRCTSTPEHIPTPRVTFRRVVASLRGPGQSPVLPFACCVGSLLSVGRCGRCSCWCRLRVRGAQWLVCRGCAGCGGTCRLRVSGAQELAYWDCAGCCRGRLTPPSPPSPPSPPPSGCRSILFRLLPSVAWAQVLLGQMGGGGVGPSRGIVPAEVSRKGKCPITLWSPALTQGPTCRVFKCPRRPSSPCATALAGALDPALPPPSPSSASLRGMGWAPLTDSASFLPRPRRTSWGCSSVLELSSALCPPSLHFASKRPNVLFKRQDHRRGGESHLDPRPPPSRRPPDPSLRCCWGVQPDPRAEATRLRTPPPREWQAKAEIYLHGLQPTPNPDPGPLPSSGPKSTAFSGPKTPSEGQSVGRARGF